MFFIPIHSVKCNTNSFFELTLEKPAGFEYILVQYVTLAVSENETKKSYFALASHPTESNLLFLIKKADNPISKLLLQYQSNPSDKLGLYISNAMGEGFPKSVLSNKHVICITHGSGISAIRPILYDFLYQNDEDVYLSLSLYYGAREQENIPFKNLLSKFVLKDKATYRYILSQSRKKDEISKTYVQTLLLNEYHNVEGPKVYPLVGSQDMVLAVTEVLLQKGVQKKELLFNF